MLFFSGNIRYLRDKLKMSQRQLAEVLEIDRSRFAKYEDGPTQAPYELLVKISRYFNISIDLLLTVDLTKYSLDEMVNLTDNRIILPIKVGKTGENKIEIIPYKAQMGYIGGYSDPEYIESLQHISLPFLRNGNYRAFPVEGDSMPPFKDGTYIIGRYIERIQDMKVNRTYLLVTRNGFVYKRLEKIEETSIQVLSDNSFYRPYEISLYDLLEIWEYEYSLLKDYDPSSFGNSDVKSMFYSLKKDIKDIKQGLHKPNRKSKNNLED